MKRIIFLHQPKSAVETISSDDISDENLNDEESSLSSLSSQISAEEMAACVEWARPTLNATG